MGLPGSKFDISQMDGTTRWKCPSDRELTLRAKLNAGWSIHSQAFFKKTDPIDRSELHLIEDVIERARKVESSERDRIERMVYRLENMKKHVIGDGIKTCSMCGIAFGIFRTSPVSCLDCSMAVCEKCRVDLCNPFQEMCVLCKICAENREVWKKSGGWFYGKVLSSSDISRLEEEIDQDNVKTFNTWEHRMPDIVRLESFEPPKESLNEHPFYKNWAVNSSPDLKSLDEDSPFFDGRLERLRKCSEVHRFDMFHLSVPDSSTICKLSASCPTLQVLEQSQVDVRELKHHFSKKRLLTPARRVVEKIAKRYRT